MKKLVIYLKSKFMQLWGFIINVALPWLFAYALIIGGAIGAVIMVRHCLIPAFNFYF